MHDMNGSPLKEGDIVNVPMEITSVSADQDFCNISVKTIFPMPGNGGHSSMTLNTKQVILTLGKQHR